MNLKEYWNRLNNHDWFYWCTEDQGVYIRGQKNYEELNDIAMEGTAQHRELLQGFRRHKFSGKDYNNEKQPKPDQIK